MRNFITTADKHLTNEIARRWKTDEGSRHSRKKRHQWVVWERIRRYDDHLNYSTSSRIRVKTLLVNISSFYFVLVTIRLWLKWDFNLGLRFKFQVSSLTSTNSINNSYIYMSTLRNMQFIPDHLRRAQMNPNNLNLIVGTVNIRHFIFIDSTRSITLTFIQSNKLIVI